MGGPLCWVPVLSFSASGPGALCVGARPSLCRGPALSSSSHGALCVRRGRSLRRAPALPGALWVGARRSLRRAGALSLSASGPGALLLSICVGICVGPPALWHPSSGPRTPSLPPIARVRVTPIQPGAFPFSDLTFWGENTDLRPPDPKNQQY